MEDDDWVNHELRREKRAESKYNQAEEEELKCNDVLSICQLNAKGLFCMNTENNTESIYPETLSSLKIYVSIGH